ncbi:hypothetical protein [Saccharopolyspora taberi]|uniref:Acyltransferase n=1 Tax=Saccharopolyspora taberi TaxID=60895 RepID=A0ABN3VI14_9PSEU
MTTRLEARYRLLLRLLPRWYRAEREEELVEVFMAAEAVREEPDDETGQFRGEYGWPDRAEVAAMVALAVRTRFGGVNAPAPARRWGDTVRLVALLGLLVQAAYSLMSVASIAVAGWVGPPQIADYLARVTAPLTWGDWREAVGLLLQLLWIPAYLLLATGRRRAARLVTAVALLPSVVAVLSAVLQDGMMLRAALVGGCVVWFSAACVFLGFHGDAPRPESRPWLIALPAAALAIGGVVVAAILAGPAVTAAMGPWADGSWALVLGGVGLLAARLCAPRSVPGPWLAAVALLCVPFALMQVGYLAVFGLPSGIPVAAVLAPPSALAVVTTVLAVSARRRQPEWSSTGLPSADRF